MFNEEEIIKYADKLLIGLSSEEAKTICDEFDIIDKNIDQINLIENLKDIEPAFMPFDLYASSLREDIAQKSVDVDDALSNTKDKLGREIRVPKVVE